VAIFKEILKNIKKSVTPMKSPELFTRTLA